MLIVKMLDNYDCRSGPCAVVGWTTRREKISSVRQLLLSHGCEAQALAKDGKRRRSAKRQWLVWK